MPQPKIVEQPYPTVALIGRTNAGKSTLFNRLTEGQRAIVSPLPNTTRDQNRGLIHWKGRTCALVDTGGLDLAALDPLAEDIQRQVKMAIADAHAIILVVDGQAEPLQQDLEAALWLKRLSLPKVVCINKCDNVRIQQTALATFARLPFSTLIPCSAKSGSGTAHLLDAVFAVITSTPSPYELQPEAAITTAIIGQPNVGKSSLFNALIGEERVIVNPKPHTTRDPHDTIIAYNDRLYTLIDTAGLRRQDRIGHGTVRMIESLSVRAAKEQIERADVVVLMLEVQRHIVHQDKALIRYVQRSGKSFVIVVNKWDLIPQKTPETINAYVRYLRQNLQFANYVPLVFTSALHRQRVLDVLNLVAQVYDFQHTTMTQEQLDQVLHRIQKLQPKEQRNVLTIRPKRLLALDALRQIRCAPVRFALVTPRPKNVAQGVIDQIEKMIRKLCPFTGVPIVIDVVAESKKSSRR